MPLEAHSKKQLLQIARKTIESYVCSGEIPKFDVTDPALHDKRGVFVTLTKKGQLRGCIGQFEAELPLYQMVINMAIASATQDPRFRSVSPEELKDIKIEISVLSPLERINKIDDIQVGVHGIYIKKGWHSGTLLPQVATEYGWDRITFLEETCYKAGLPADAWKDKDTEIYVYTAEVFHENEDSTNELPK